MLQMFWPMGLVIASNVVYNLCTKLTPQKASPFLSLSVTYLVGTLISFVLYLVSSTKGELLQDLSSLNWTALLLGMAIVGLEVGYIFIYRAGWSMSTGSLVANICLACALLVIGVLLFKEQISIRQIFGMLFCGVGLFLITK